MLLLRRSLALAGSAVVLLLAACDSGPGAGRTAVISSIDSPQLTTKCPDGECVQYSLQNFQCGRWMRASNVIVAGHVSPPAFLAGSAEQLAAAVQCFHPELVVVDTCYGTSTELLKAFAQAGVNATVVASPRKVPAEGFQYSPAFWADASSVAERAAAVQPSNPAQKMIRWALNGAVVERAEQLVAAMKKEEMEPRLQRISPNLVKIEPEPHVELLVRVPPERFR